MKKYLDFVLLNLLILSAIIVSPIFADHVTTDVSIPAGTSVMGCEKTNSCFDPAYITTDVGSEVTWHNDDTAVHTVTSGNPTDGHDDIFDSSIVAAGNTFSHIFDEAGTFNYFCQVHPWMIGVVNVESIMIKDVPVSEKITISNPSTVNTSGEQLNEYYAGDQIQITADLTNNQNVKQPFVFLINVWDQNGKTFPEMWISGSLIAKQTLNAAQSWIPKDPGKYTVQISVLDNIISRNSLTSSVQMTIVVEGYEEPPPTTEFDFEISTNMPTVITEGESVKSSVTIMLKSGDPQQVYLSCSVKPSGTCDIYPDVIVPKDVVTAIFSSPDTPQNSMFELVITGTAGKITHEEIININVQPQSDADADGLTDNVDACPNQWGLSEFSGCPPPQMPPEIPPWVAPTAGGVAAVVAVVAVLGTIPSPSPSLNIPPNATLTVRIDVKVGVGVR